MERKRYGGWRHWLANGSGRRDGGRTRKVTSLSQPRLDCGFAFKALRGTRNPICRLFRGSSAISSWIASMIAWIESL